MGNKNRWNCREYVARKCDRFLKPVTFNTLFNSSKITTMSTSKYFKKKYLLLFGLLLFLAAGGLFHRYVMQKIDSMNHISVEFGSTLDEEKSQAAFKAVRITKAQQKLKEKILPKLPKSQAFKEVSLFDEDAKSWNNLYDGYVTCGIVVFDANGDELPDVYMTQNGNTWTRPTDENGVLQDKPYPQHNALYLHQGNDKNGQPIYQQVKYLATKNKTFQKEELLIENFLFPRENVGENVDRPGRLSSVPLAVDLNGDSRLDLIVGSYLPGMFWSSPLTQQVMEQFVRPVGRQAVKSKLPIQAQGLAFLKDYQANHDINDVQKSARGTESNGANSIFLNMGDQDQDGLPEWKDISRESGLEGKRATLSLLAADFDLDGDIDIFEANSTDPDYWPGGATKISGGANQLFINQLVETGELKFVEKAAAMNVDGVYDKDYPSPAYYRLKKYPLIPEAYSAALLHFEKYHPGFLEINGEASEQGQLAWCATTQDVNDDGYPDIWVGNDIGFMRLYLNKAGKTFELAKDYARANQTGNWMSMSVGDLNGDLKEDLFAGNSGGSTMNMAMPIPNLYSMFSPVMLTGIMSQQFFANNHRSMHAFVSGADVSKEMPNQILHSSVLPPDAASPNNIRSFGLADRKASAEYDPNSLDPYEFAWGSTILDVQNDGKQDIYWMGNMYGRGGGIFPITGTGPGRLLVNATESPDAPLQFADLTAEHHLFNIHELQYDKLKSDNYIYRKSPQQNWSKKSMVYSYDVSVWGFQGPEIVEKVANHDLTQTSENGRGAVGADLNSDGYADIIIRNMGGYDSRSPDNVNLKAVINDKVQVIPAHDSNFPTPTNYEPGSTRTFLNQYQKNNWLKIKLVDDSPNTFNPDAVGAKIVVNQQFLKVHRAGGSGFVSNYFGPQLFGLGQQEATSIEVTWPDKEQTTTQLPLPNYKNGTLIIAKNKGIVKWEVST